MSQKKKQYKKVFFTASIYTLPGSMGVYSSIAKEIHEAGSVLAVDWLREWKKKMGSKNKKKLSRNDVSNAIDEARFHSNTQKISDCDAVIAEVTNPTIGVGYQIFYAENKKKPILALYDPKLADVEGIRAVVNESSLYVTLKSYNSVNLNQKISSFLKKEDKELKKFNFIISREIDDYLKWSKKSFPDKTKSELLREIVTSSLEEDKDFIKFLKGRKKK